jgi:hypothetical protein
VKQVPDKDIITAIYLLLLHSIAGSISLFAWKAEHLHEQRAESLILDITGRRYSRKLDIRHMTLPKVWQNNSVH